MSTFTSNISAERNAELKEIHWQQIADLWTVARDAEPGDVLVFYARKPVSGFVAVGVVQTKPFLSDGEFGWEGKYLAEISIEHIVDPPLALGVLRQYFPEWGWLKKCRGPTCVGRELEPKLFELLQFTPDETDSVKTGGAGFGTDPEHNRRVEEAAVEAVWEWFLDEGWTVKDRQSEGCGYDLLCRRGREERHVEVKGVAGNELSFIITANEVKTAEADPHFMLSVATRALEPEALTMHDFSREEFLDGFALSPLAYKATLREQR